MWGKPSAHSFPQIACGILDYRQWWLSLLLLQIFGNREATRRVSKLGGLVFKFDISINQILKLASCFEMHVRSLWKFSTPPPQKKQPCQTLEHHKLKPKVMYKRGSNLPITPWFLENCFCRDPILFVVSALLTRKHIPHHNTTIAYGLFFSEKINVSL